MAKNSKTKKTDKPKKELTKAQKIGRILRKIERIDGHANDKDAVIEKRVEAYRQKLIDRYSVDPQTLKELRHDADVLLKELGLK